MTAVIPHDPTTDATTLPRLEFDELLVQPVSRAQNLMGTQNRLRGLLAANTAIIGDLDLPVALRHIVEVARDLVDARYGAIGVPAPADGPEQFVHAGVEEGLVGRIGRLPTGQGLLSVPIRVRDELFGNLYLAKARSGRFSADDEQVAVALAATAGVVIENARLFEQARRRQQWLHASMEIQQRLLAADGPDPLQLIADRARVLAEADLVTIVLPGAEETQLQVEVAAGEGAAGLHGYAYPAKDTMAALALSTGQAVMSPDVTADARFTFHPTRTLDVGPAMMIPLTDTSGVRGVLAVARARGRRPFDEADFDMATAFAAHAAVALGLAAARVDQERVRLLEDRNRIAHDLHDHVIQRLFAAGMSLQGVPGLGDAERLARVDGVIDDIDDVIAQIRSTIFGLRGALGPQL